jgi:hypothetical protein
MKKVVAYVMTGMLSLSLVGCSNAKDTRETVASPIPTQAPTLAPMATATPTPSLAPTPTMAPIDKIIAFTEDNYKEDFFTEDKVQYSTIHTTYPVLSGTTDSVVKINEALMKEKENYIESAKEWGKTILEDPSYVHEEYFIPYDFYQGYSIAYNDNGILNVVLDGYDYTGGAHGMPSLVSLIYDLKTGEQLSLTDFLAVDETTFHDRVYQAFEKMYQENPENFFEGDSLTYMDEGITLDMNFHLGDEGVTFYFYPYEVSFYAAGFIETTIPWSDPIFKQIQN